MNRIRTLAAMCLFTVLLFCCVSGLAEAVAPPAPPDAPEHEGKAQWTVMMYLSGTDLETEGAMATYNLMELAQTTPNDQVNVVFQTGGTKQWHADEMIGLDIDETKLQRYQFDQEGYTLVDEQPLTNMASAQTLTEFIQWGAKTYPAEKYLLVMWDHGGGSLYGLIQDELHNNAIMPLDQLEIALKNAGVPLEAVLLDTCLMATLETAQAVQPSAKYLIAAQETVPGYGSAYATWMQFLYDTPGCDGARIGRVVCNSIQQKYAEMGMLSASRQLTFSVIDLSKIDAVSKAFDQMFVEAGKLLSDPEDFYAFAYQAQHAQHFNYNTMVDLGDLATRTRNTVLSNEVAGAVIEAVDAAVVYNLKGDQRSYATGLSFYYEPAAPYTALDHYARVCKNAPYLAFLDAASMQWTAPEWVYEQTERLPDITRENYIVETAVNLTQEGQLKLTITNAPAAVTAVYTTIYQYEKATDTWLKLGRYADVSGSFEQGIFYASFPEQWLTMNGEFVQLDLVEETDSYVLYSIPFQAILPDEEPIPLEFRIGYTFNDEYPEMLDDAQADNLIEQLPEGAFEFYGVWDQDSADSISLPSRNVQDISAYYGVPIQLMRKRMQLPGYDLGMNASGTFTLDSTVVPELQSLPRGQYFVMFDVVDVFGNWLQTQQALVDWNGKTAVYSGVEVEAETTEQAEEDIAAEPAEEAAAA